MNGRVRWSDRVRYAVDNTFSRGTAPLIVWLAALSLIVVLLAALLLSLTGTAREGEGRLGLVEAAWRSLMRMLDAVTLGGDTGWGFRLIMLAVTLGGVFVISTLIGVLTSGVEGKLEELRKGRSRVVESGHTAILGRNEQVFTIISELAIANENQRRPCIVILGDHDEVDMEDQARQKVGDTGRTCVVCRTGSPMEMANLSIASLNAARSIILLSPDSEDADCEVIKIILAITNHPECRKELYHIVAELRDVRNTEVASVVGRDEVE